MPSTTSRSSGPLVAPRIRTAHLGVIEQEAVDTIVCDREDAAMRLLGRDAQLAVASTHLDDLRRGRGRLVLLAGEPGVGKSRLAEEIATQAGTRVVWATSWPGDGAPPLWPWVQVLRALGAETALSHPEESAAAAEAVRFAQLDAVVSALRAASRDAPIVVVLDDLQWADAASVRVLAFVAGALHDLACLVIATYRTGELDRADTAEIARLGTTVAVPPLSADAAAELLRTAAGGDISASAVDAVVRRSSGNPLFLWEFGQLMAQSGRLDIAPAAVPDAVAAVIERRLARYAEDDVDLFRVAAVLGDPFSSALVAAVSGRVSVDVVGRLQVAVRNGLLVEADDDGFAFSHALVRDVVLDAIEYATRVDLHRRVAVALGPRAHVDPLFHAVVADHLLHAGQRREAARHWELAAHAARRMVAYAEAAALFERAASCSDEPRHRIELGVEHGETLLLAGDLAGARACFTDAAAAARAADQPDLLARAVLGIGTGPVAWEVPLADVDHAALVHDALDRLPADDTRLRSMLLARLSVTAATPETQHVARARAEEALALAEADGDPALIGQALAALNDAIAGPDHAMARRDNADAIVELGMTAGDRALELLGYRFRLVADLELGDTAAADRDILAFSRLADALRQPLISWYVPLFRGMRALLAGDVALARRYQQEVAAAAEHTRSTNAALLAASLEMGIDLADGTPFRAGVLSDVIDVDPTVWATYAAGLSEIELRAGNDVRARELLHLHSHGGFVRLGDDSERVTTLLFFTRVALALGELDAAATIYELLAPHAGLWSVDGIAACCYGPVELALAHLAFALDHRDVGLAHLARAVADIERADAPLFALDAAALARRLGAPAAPVGDAGDNTFRRDGQFWTLTYRGTTTRLKDAKGLRDLARLVAEPGRELHVLDLASGDAHAGAPRQGDLGELLDTRARAEYRRRLAEIDDELADAEACGDAHRAQVTISERDFLAAELAAALGLGGRARRAGSPAERARKAVTGRIRMTIGRIGEDHPALARHLEVSVRTGTYCAYVPELDVTWTVVH